MSAARLGVIGVGGFGLFCLQQYLRMPELRVTAIAGTKPEKYARLAEEYDIPFFTVDWRELARHPEVDIVYLATPPALHAEQARYAIEAGKHVFCEKPLALTPDDADGLLEASERAGVRVGVNFVMRYSGGYALLETILRENLFGRPIRLSFENLAGDLPARHWFWDAQQSGGVLVEHGVHFFDIFAFLLGGGDVLCAAVAPREDDRRDRWLAALRYTGGALGTFFHAFSVPSALEHTEATIECDLGTVRLSGWIPNKISCEGLLDDAGLERINRLMPKPEMIGMVEVMKNEEEAALQHIRAVADFGEKQEIYAGVVRDAMSDFVRWTRDSSYVPCVTGADGRDALLTAWKATRLALGAAS